MIEGPSSEHRGRHQRPAMGEGDDATKAGEFSPPIIPARARPFVPSVIKSDFLSHFGTFRPTENITRADYISFGIQEMGYLRFYVMGSVTSVKINHILTIDSRNKCHNYVRCKYIGFRKITKPRPKPNFATSVTFTGTIFARLLTFS